MGDYVNEERTEAAQRVLEYYYTNNLRLHGFNSQHNLTELLCDLNHYAVQQGIPWGKCLGGAREKWSEEVKPKRQGKSHELDPTEMRSITHDGVVLLPCIHGKMHNEPCRECYDIMQKMKSGRPWWKRLFGR